jgi:NAD(P)-dependent dehydrogenase (short-subunit alcohol dehydrogenase family)
VNNIGVAHAGNVVDTSEETWDRVLRTSLKTTFLASKSVVPVMAAQRCGAIVNISSISASRGGNYVAYAAAKGGVMAVTPLMMAPHLRAEQEPPG